MNAYNRRRYDPPLVIEIARQALKQGPLLRESGGFYRSRGRRFSVQVVNKLVENGEAMRIGEGVVSLDHLRALPAALFAA